MSILTSRQGSVLGAYDYTGTKTISPHDISNQLAKYAAQQQTQAYPVMRSVQVAETDMLIHKVRNGYQVTLYGAGEPQVYVAKDLDEVAEVLKLASVNSALDKAK